MGGEVVSIQCFSESSNGLAQGGFESGAVGFEFFLRQASGDGVKGIEDDGDFGERQRQFEAVPGFEFEGAAVMDASGQDGAAGELGQFDNAGLELEAGAARTVRGDADVGSSFELFRQEDQGGHAFLGLGTGATRGHQTELGANIGDDLAIATGAGEHGADPVGEPVLEQPGEEEHLVVPESPDDFFAVGVKRPSPVFDLHGQGGADAAHEPCEEFASGTDANFSHERRGWL